MTPLAPLFTASRTASFGVPVHSILGRLASLGRRPDAALFHHRSAVVRANQARADHLVTQAHIAIGLA